jgi:DNA-binding CsgD family transcriptional regulator
VVVDGHGGRKSRRSYRPTVEALEALRLLSSATQSLPDLSVPGDVLTGHGPALLPAAPTDLAWDEALTQTDVAALFGGTTSPSPGSGALVIAPAGSADVEAGIAQLDRYLSRAWYRAGIPPQVHDDCTQAVYVTLLQNLGRDRFDALLGDIGRSGIRDVLSRETPEGPDFFRAVDTVKKRAQREKSFQPIDALDIAAASTGEDARALWRGALQEAIDQSLTPREASLVYDTLMGKTPAEIALQWGVAPKTVSNEKTRVLQKLRDVLVADLSD